MGVTLDLQNDGADITLTARLLLKFTVAGWNEIGGKKSLQFFISLLLHMFLMACTNEELNTAPWNFRRQLLRF